MSYAFDAMMIVWRKRIEPHVEDKELARLFEEVIEEMHDANHDVPDAKGVFKGDGVNKSSRVTKAARELEACSQAVDVAEKQVEDEQLAKDKRRAKLACTWLRCPECGAGCRLRTRFLANPDAVHLCPTCKAKLVDDSTVILSYDEVKVAEGPFVRVLPEGVRRVGEGTKARYESDDPRLLDR